MKVHQVASLQEYRRFEQETRAAYAEHLQQLQSLLPGEERAFTAPGFSHTADRPVDFECDFRFSRGFPHVNWRERVVCPVTRLNNRARAAVHVFELFGNAYAGDPVFLMEQTTPLYRHLKARYSRLVGAEFLGDAVPLGTQNARGIRNEDARRLSFGDGTLQAILSFDVFEHIHDYRAAFRESHRALAGGGSLIFTVPFRLQSEDNLERATLAPDGQVTHLLPPEYHGDPLNRGGILCFWHFGWEMLQDLRAAGFESAVACIFHSTSLGYFTHQVIFHGRKGQGSAAAPA